MLLVLLLNITEENIVYKGLNTFCVKLQNFKNVLLFRRSENYSTKEELLNETEGEKAPSKTSNTKLTTILRYNMHL